MLSFAMANFPLGQFGSVISHAKETVSHYQDGYSNGMKTHMESSLPRIGMTSPPINTRSHDIHPTQQQSGLHWRKS
jgi:hypothetical protein